MTGLLLTQRLMSFIVLYLAKLEAIHFSSSKVLVYCAKKDHNLTVYFAGNF